MPCRPSNALLAVAVLLAARAPASRAAAAAIAVLDPARGDAVPFPAVGAAPFPRDAPPSRARAATLPAPDPHAAFAAWTTTFARAYDGAHERARRKRVWLENHARIEAHNARASSYSLAHNDFSDLTNDEFRRRHFLGEYSPGVKKPRGRREEASAGRFPSSSGRHLLRSDATVAGGDEAAEATVAEVPDAKDWAAEGAVTAVKNQWFCGACWAYSAVGAIEGIRYIKTGNLTELSMQQLIDCDKTDLGCGGGLMDQAFQYEDKVGLCALAEYPMAYHRHWLWGCSVSDAPSPATWWHDGNCRPLPRTRVRRYVDVEAREAALRAAVATQPVSVAVAAGDWQFYSGGVLDARCEEPIDHGVLAVGYGQATASGTAGAAGHDYWLVKNSWGTAWGEKGYIRLARGIGNEPTNGTACVLTMASRPVMSAED